MMWNSNPRRPLINQLSMFKPLVRHKHKMKKYLIGKIRFVHLSIKIPDQLHMELKIYCARNGISMTELLVHLIRDLLRPQELGDDSSPLGQLS